MRLKKESKLQVLSLLNENLKKPQPQVVGIDEIAWKLQMSLKETRQLLLKMDQDGEIKSDMEGHHSLITRVGLSELNAHSATVRA